MAVDLREWPNKKEAAELIGISSKTLERMVARGEIEQRMRPRPRASDEACYNPKHVQKAAANKNVVIVRPVVEPPAESQQGQYAVVEAILERLLPRLLPALPPPAPEPESELDLLTIRQAQRRGYRRDWIREQVRLGNLKRYGRSYSLFELQRLIGR